MRTLRRRTISLAAALGTSWRWSPASAGALTLALLAGARAGASDPAPGTPARAEGARAFAWPGTYDLAATGFPEGVRTAVMTLSPRDTSYVLELDGPPGRLQSLRVAGDSAHVVWDLGGEMMYVELRGVGAGLDGRWRVGDQGGAITGTRWTAANASARRDLLAAERALAEAFARADVQRLDGLHTAAYRHTDAQGVVSDKAELLGFVRMLAAGTAPFKLAHVSVDRLRAYPYGDAAVVTGIMTSHRATPARADTSYERFTHTYVRQQGQWQLAAEQVADVPVWMMRPLGDGELTAVAPRDCGQGSASKSLRADSRTFLRLKNETAGEVKSYWLDYDGKRDQERPIKPGASIDIYTYLTHPFVIVDAGGRCLALFTPTAAPGLAVVQGR